MRPSTISQIHRYCPQGRERLRFAFGSLLDGQYDSDESVATDETIRKLEYFFALACYMGHVARIDGFFHDSERTRIHEILDSVWEELSIPRNELVDTFSYESYRDQGIACEDGVSALLTEAKENTALRSLMVSAAWRVCAADGVFEDSEISFMQAIASELDIPREEAIELSLQYYRPSGNTDRARRYALCRILDIALDASETETTKAYRRKAHAYHPDRHLNDNPTIQAAFSDAFKQVNSAYKELLELDSTCPPLLWGLDSEHELRFSFEDSVCACFFCFQTNRLPTVNHYENARCGKCQSLLLFEEDLARKFS